MKPDLQNTKKIDSIQADISFYVLIFVFSVVFKEHCKDSSDVATLDLEEVRDSLNIGIILNDFFPNRVNLIW